MTHPILSFEEDLRMYLKAVLQWILMHRPIRTNFKGLMFSEPTSKADAQLFTFNGVTFNTRFFGSVRTQPVEWTQKAPAKPRIIKP